MSSTVIFTEALFNVVEKQLYFKLEETPFLKPQYINIYNPF